MPPQEVYEGDHVVELSNPELGKSRRVVVSVRPGERAVLRQSLD